MANRSQDIHALVTSSEKETLQREARLLGMTVSSYVCWLIRNRSSLQIVQAIQKDDQTK